MTDLEKQHSTERTPLLDSKKSSTDVVEKLPLFLGRWAVEPEKIFRIGLTGYVIWFLLHRLADVAYILTVDARFPEGLGHLYPSEAQRMDSVSYTREVLLCGMIHRTVVFLAVFALIFFQLFARFDNSLRSFYASVASWWETCFVYRSFSYCWSPVGRCLSFCLSCRPFTYLVALKDHALHGRLATDFLSRFGFRYSIWELLHGSLYLTLLGACFFVLSGPFMYWHQSIDLKFGFANSLSVNINLFKYQFVSGLVSMLISGVPQKLMFLAVLQYRLGWVFMWAGLFISIIYAQYNVAMIAPMLGMNNQFPAGNFAVGRGFPLVTTPFQSAPWISLNRVYFADPYGKQQEVETYYTMDKSKGQLALMHKPSGDWVISGNPWVDPAATIYSKSLGAASQQLVDGLREQSWNVGGTGESKIGVRSGKELRDKLFGFARENRIGIGDIYMVDGSHADARGNAFVTGAGNHSIIGLYDTLFLGQRGSDEAEDSKDDEVQELADGKSLIQHASEVVQDVDLEQAEQDTRRPRNSAPTQAMNDDEIVSILAHELAHSAMRHMEQGMGAQIFTSFVTFATLGWMAHSPLAAAAMMLSAPVLHVGAGAYEHLVGPPLDGILKLFTDGLTRHNEYEADGYAAMISERYANALQTSLAKLSVNSNQDPDVPFFFEALHSDHPTFARRWEHIEKVKLKTYGKKKP